MSGSFRWLGLFAGIAALFYFLSTLSEQISSIPAFNWDLIVCISILCAIIFNILIILIGGISWWMLLFSCGETIAKSQILLIYVLSQFGKYIPGNIAHHAGRVALAGKRGIEFSRVAISMIIETSWIIAAASIIGISCFVFKGNVFFGKSLELPAIYQYLLSALTAILLPIVIGWLLFRWQPKSVFKRFENLKIESFSLTVLVSCLINYLFCFFLMGLTSYILLKGAFGVGSCDLWLLTGTFAVAWTAGFFTPGAPAGIGVRETVMLELLSPVYGAGVIVGLAILLRIITTMTDGIVFFGALLFQKYKI